jgi:hypothetical protein
MTILPSSFRDPAGFVFEHNGEVFRQVNRVYSDNYRRLMESGLYEELVGAGLLVSHEETDIAPARSDEAYCVIKPQQVPFVTYPYEFCFSQYRDAALVTLDIQKRSLARGMVLKDASAYNTQLIGGQPTFIDTLSFDQYREGTPWIAYGQFCRHFLAPLALMSYVDARLVQLMGNHVDGVPLDLAASILPWRSRLRLTLLSHLHLHARSQRRFADQGIRAEDATVSPRGMSGLIDNLEAAVSSLKVPGGGVSTWSEYYDTSNYSDTTMADKCRLVENYVASAKPHTVWDLGANTGRFSCIAANVARTVVASDSDPLAVDQNYRANTRGACPNIVPLLIDLTNPSPALGWNNTERPSWFDRGEADLVLALAIIHHMAIANNVPLSWLVDFLARLAPNAVAEFVPKSDPQVKRLLSSREDIFPEYSREGFERACRRRFNVIDSQKLVDSERVLYLLKLK